MTTKIHATYRDGVFRPTEPVPVAEGAEVELTVTVPPSAASLADAMEQIARLPLEGPRDGFSGADHDQILYKKQNNK